MIKRFARNLLKSWGIVAFRRSSGVYIPEEESYTIISRLVGRDDPVIVDGGTHRGDTVDTLAGMLPQAQFHCFEPDPALDAELLDKFSGRADVHVNKAALGASPGKAVFNINASRPTNSLLPAAEGIQSDLKGLCKTVERIEVAVTSIDDYCAGAGLDRVDVIKLDLQGYDYEALLGARATMPRVTVVLVEVLFTEIYQGCRLFPDILRLMAEYGFRLFTLSGIHYGAHDELLWADAIFVKSDFRHDTVPVAA